MEAVKKDPDLLDKTAVVPTLIEIKDELDKFDTGDKSALDNIHEGIGELTPIMMDDGIFTLCKPVII